MTKKHALATAFDSADDSTGLMLWRVTNAWQAAQRAALKPFGLTHVQFVLLAALAWFDGDERLTQQQLAAHAHTDPMMTSQVLRALESAGLLERVRHPTDGRARLLRATPDGIALVNRAVVSVEAVDADFFAPLGAETAAFTRSLSALVSRG